jgi:hypothetical protein
MNETNPLLKQKKQSPLFHRRRPRIRPGPPAVNVRALGREATVRALVPADPAVVPPAVPADPAADVAAVGP